MSENLTEDQQVEELKKWWKENGRSIIAGIVIGLAAVGGWQGWNKYQDAQAESGAVVYDQFSAAVNSGNAEGINNGLAQLRGEYGKTTFFVLAQLQMADLQLESGNPDEAIASLRDVVSAAGDQGLQQLASIRLARVLVSQDRLNEAKDALADVYSEGFSGESAAIRGEIARREGRTEDARAAFEEARLKGAADSELLDYQLIEMATTGEKQEKS